MERVGESEVKKALTADQGSEAKLVSWSLEKLTGDFDGQTSLINNIRVKYEDSGLQWEVCYVVKITKTREVKPGDFYNLIFTQECKFYSEIVPGLNSVLEAAGERPLGFPKCYYFSLEKGKEIIILENLREKGYRMEDKVLGLDEAHASIVLKELGRLHAASYLLQAKTPVDLSDKFDSLKIEWTRKFNLGCDWGTFVDGLLDTGLKMFEKMGDCETVVNWLRSVRPHVSEMYEKQLVRRKPFTVIVHGDCWINNLLFKHDEAGRPVGVMFLDLQGSRYASVAIDLQHFLNLNVHGRVRRPNFDSLLATYFSSLSSTLQAGDSPVPFTLEELREEYMDKGFYGVLYSIMWLPLMLRPPEQGVYILHEAKLTELNTVLSLVDTNPLLKSTILSVVEEWTEQGVIS